MDAGSFANVYTGAALVYFEGVNRAGRNMGTGMT